MKRWKLWTAVASSIVSIGSGSSYYFWNRSAGTPVAEVAADSQADSPHTLPPQPIPDSSADLRSSPQFVSPASFNAPAAKSTGNGGNSDAAPGRPSFDSAPYNPPSAEPPSRYSFQSPADSPRFRTSFSDDSASTPNAADASAQVNNEPLPAPASDEQPEVSTSYTLPSSAAVSQENPDSSETPASSQPDASGDGTKSEVANEQPAAAAPPPRPSTLRAEDKKSAGPDLSSPPSSPPSTAPSTPSDTNPSGNRYSNPSRPAAPSLRKSIPRNGLTPQNDPPATLQDSSIENSATPLPAATIAPRSSVPRASRLTSAAPGERKLEGMQAPTLTVERSAPEESQVGKPSKFVVRVRNVGKVIAQDVVVSDQVPQGTQFLSATPETNPSNTGELIWEIGALQPGEESTLTVELLPEAEGEIGSVAEVTFRIQAAVRTIATKPLLKVEHSGPAKILIGEDVPFQINVANPGSGVATGVVVEVDVPDGLTHDGGREIMSDRFDLRPNESHKIDLVLKAVGAGAVQSVVRAVGDHNLRAEHRTEVEVLAPQLQIAVVGPTRRFLDRPVKYQIGLSNPGTAAAQEIELVARLPRGLKFISADKKGQYDPGQHAVSWSLEELPAGEQGSVELTGLPTDPGEQKLHVEARGALNLAHQHEHTTVVEDITDLAFTVSDENVPIEVGSETSYQIRIANNGTKVARNVRLAVQIPNGLEVTDSDGPTQIQQQADQLIMQPIAQLGQREEAVYRITAKGTRAGDHVLRVQLLSDESPTPVTKEEITKVYADK